MFATSSRLHDGVINVASVPIPSSSSAGLVVSLHVGDKSEGGEGFCTSLEA